MSFGNVTARACVSEDTICQVDTRKFTRACEDRIFTGAVCASVGYISNREDADALVSLVRSFRN